MSAERPHRREEAFAGRVQAETRLRRAMSSGCVRRTILGFENLPRNRGECDPLKWVPTSPTDPNSGKILRNNNIPHHPGLTFAGQCAILRAVTCVQAGPHEFCLRAVPHACAGRAFLPRNSWTGSRSHRPEGADQRRDWGIPLLRRSLKSDGGRIAPP
eukprot:358882-Chlamydomonas_euryale.AAC.3